MLKKNNLFLTILFISLSLNISFSADNDAPFGDILLHHVTNDTSEKGIYIPIEIGGIDLSITKHVILIWAVSLLVIILALLGTARYRKNKNALITNPEIATERIIRMLDNKSIYSVNGKKIPCEINSICIHGDTKNSILIAKKIRTKLIESNFSIKQLPELRIFQ